MDTLTAQEFIDVLKKENISRTHLTQLVVDVLQDRGLKIATAESCTGGMVSEKLTQVSGVSSVFELGVCSYANRIKEKVLGVNHRVLDTVGAVSEETAKEMARGVRELGNSSIGVSTTGIAGPTGGSDQKPVGLVYIGCSTGEKTYAYKTLLGNDGENDRDAIRDLASDIALYIVLKELKTTV